MAKTTISVNEWASVGFKDFVSEDLISAANTQIQNRAQVANSLKAVMGVERVHTRSVANLLKEYGPSDQPVWESDNKDARIRFVGTWYTSQDSNGTRPRTDTVNDFAEVTFFGTGLNLLHRGQGSSPSVLYTLDGGTENVTSVLINQSSSIAARGNNTNQVYTVVSNLSVGWHTVKLRLSSGSAFEVYGFEFINERTNVLIPAGNAFSGMKKQSLLAAVTSAHNSSVSGARGARVIKYALDGVIAEAVTNVDTTSKYLALTDHINEEAYRTVVYTEFGANRSDDWSSTLTSSSRSFTLDDGTTTLAGVIAGNTTSGEGYIVPNFSVGHFIAITFVGTGLDIIGSSTTGGASSAAGGVIIDGVSQGEITVTAATGTSFLTRQKICSGLPYGTHTVKITRNTEMIKPYSFVIYQPKKPTLPAGAVELCDYNVMATYVANATAGIFNIGTGTLRKSVLREITYVGASWVIQAIDPTAYVNGWQISSNVNGSYFEYTFFGTGFELRAQAATGISGTNTISLQALGGSLVTLSSANFPGLTTSSYGGMTYTYASGNIAWNTSSTLGSGISINGLALGLYKVRVTNGTSSNFILESLDVITPIHINASSTKTGSLSLKDSRTTKPIPAPERGVDLTKAKAYVLYDQVNGKILASMNVAAIVTVTTGEGIVYFTKPFKNANYLMTGSSIGAGFVSLANTSIAAGHIHPDHFRYYTTLDSGAQANRTYVAMVFFGELEDES